MSSFKISKNFVFALAFSAGLVSFSCQDEKNTTDEKTQEVKSETTNATNKAAGKSTKVEVPSGDDPNPAHGQLGHRCDIAVGAPLNSSPTNKKPELKVNNGAEKSANTDNLKVNPAHGQPGHRCELPVGASLEN